MNNEYDELKAVHSQFTSAFQEVIKLLNVDQLKCMLDRKTRTLAALDERWSDNRSHFQANLIYGLEVIKFRLTEQLHIAETGEEASTDQLNFVCIKCNIPFFHADASSVCIMCGETKYIEVDRIDPPSE